MPTYNHMERLSQDTRALARGSHADHWDSPRESTNDEQRLLLWASWLVEIQERWPDALNFGGETRWHI